MSSKGSDPGRSSWFLHKMILNLDFGLKNYIRIYQK